MINDLNVFVLPRMEELQLQQNVHFKDSGSEVLGKLVAEIIRKQI